MSFRYYVLTSGPLWTLKRQFTFLKTNETVVVINTLDDDYAVEASEFCELNDIEHYVTESDGTPSTGKNSVLRLFLESDYQYMVHVDGDDLITPYGRNLYRTVSLQDSPPDMICLANQLGVQHPQKDFFDLFKDQKDSNTVKTGHFYIPRKHYCVWPHDLTTKQVTNYRPIVSEGEIQRLVKDGIDEKTARIWMEHRKIIEEYTVDYGDRLNTLNRLVFHSRKAAELMNYDPELIIGEDAFEYYKVKTLAYEGKLRMCVRNEKPKYSYLYMQDVKSITRDGHHGGEAIVDLSWIQLLIQKLNKLKLYPKGYRLPEFSDPYYEDE